MRGRRRGTARNSEAIASGRVFPVHRALGFAALINFGAFTAGFLISWLFPGRLRFSGGASLTGVRARADSKIAWTTRISAKPSSPDGSALRFFKIQSEKYI